MKVGAMQPYFLPYLGYFQLLESVDVFILRDAVKYSKGGWVNRNIVEIDGNPVWATVPLQRASDFSTIADRKIASTYSPDKLFTLINRSCGHLPYWGQAKTLIETVVFYQDPLLSNFLSHSIKSLSSFLEIETTILRESGVFESPKGTPRVERLISMVKTVGGSEYVNAPGGTNLYSADDFAREGLSLRFLQPHLPAAGPPGSEWGYVSSIQTICSIGQSQAIDLVRNRFSIS